MNATYTCNGHSYPAAVRLERSGLFIGLQRPDGSGDVLWLYENIRPSERPNLFAYNDYPPQGLEVLDQAVATALHDAVVQRQRTARVRRFGPLAKVMFVALAVFAAAYLFVVPWLAGVLASRFPQSYEQELGNRVFNAMRTDFRIDQPATEAANRFFTALRFPTTYPVHITVVKGDVANAFALPGGRIVIYDRLLRGIDNYEELAALMAHEFVHVQQRHTLRSLFRQLGGTIFLSLLVGDASAVAAVVLNNANELKNLSYSRKLENEADEQGVQLLQQRGISCRGFVQLFRFLKKESGALQPSEWLSSHPDLTRRISNVQKSGKCDTGQKDEQLQGLFLQLKTAE